MPNIGGSNESYRQQSQYMNIRGAQISEQYRNNKEGQRQAHKAASKKQLLGTIIGIAIVFLILILLKIIGIL